jgi:hypothetical protein
MSISLRDLDAHFIRLTKAGWRHVRSIDKAQGVQFLCPKCFRANGGRVGTHSVVCWSRSRGVPDDMDPKPGRWTLHGTSMDDLQLEGDPVGQARSVLLLGGCAWHGFINNGRAEGDC